MHRKSRVNKSSQKTQFKQQQGNEIKNESQQKTQFSLYLLLQVDKTATLQQIKKQYRKLVLKYHPDKNKQDPEARDKFQKLKQAYDILSDSQKRKIYDQTGSTGQQQFDEKAFQSAYEYFRTIYKKVTKQDIQEFEKNYRFGKMEEEDLLSYYEQNEGNMRALIESIPLSCNEDVPRFIKFFQQKIKNKELEKYKAFDKTKNKVRLLKDESQEFKQEQEKSLKQLAIAIRDKNVGHQKDFLAALEEKYGGKKAKTRKEHLPVNNKINKRAKKSQ